MEPDISLHNRDTRILRKWTPKWLGISMFVFLFFPIIFVNGAYSSNAGEMTSGLGIISENIQFANFLSAIGMAVFAPMLLPLMRIRRPKMVMLTGFIMFFFLSMICALTISMPLLFLCSFLMGLLRIMLLFNTIFSMLEYVTGMDVLAHMIPEKDETDPQAIAGKDRFKSLALPLVYLFFVSLSQLGSAITAWLAHEYEWQYTYLYMCGFVLLALLLVIVLMKFQPRSKNAKMKWTHFGDLVAATLSLASFAFIFVYGKTLDWFGHPYIHISGIIFLISTGLLFFFAANSHKPYLDLEIFTSKRVITALLFFFLLMVVNSSSMLVNAYAGISMKLNNLQSAGLSNWSLLGYLIGGAAAFIMTKKEIPFKYMFAIGFGLIALSAIYMYFQYQSMGLYENMIFPIVLRSTGMIMLYALCGTYGMLSMRMNKYFASWMFLMLAIRSVIAPVAGVALYSNLLNERSQHYIVSLSQNVDRMDTEFTASYDNTQVGMMMQGYSYEQAEQIAATSTKGRIQVQATLSALKEITGWTIYASVGCIIFALAYPYNKRGRKSRKQVHNRFGWRFIRHFN